MPDVDFTDLATITAYFNLRSALKKLLLTEIQVRYPGAEIEVKRFYLREPSEESDCLAMLRFEMNNGRQYEAYVHLPHNDNDSDNTPVDELGVVYISESSEGFYTSTAHLIWLIDMDISNRNR